MHLARRAFEHEFEVVVERERSETVERGARERHRKEPGADRFNASDLNVAPDEFVADPLNAADGGCDVHGWSGLIDNVINHDQN
jgi:hypothetical protein